MDEVTQSDTTREPKTTEFLRRVFVDCVCAQFSCVCVHAHRKAQEHSYEYMSVEEYNALTDDLCAKYDKQFFEMKRKLEHALSMYAGTNKDCSIVGYDAEAFGGPAREILK